MSEKRKLRPETLAVHAGKLVLSTPKERHGARMPFDFLLRSLAVEAGSSGSLAFRPSREAAASSTLRELAGVLEQLVDVAACELSSRLRSTTSFFTIHRVSWHFRTRARRPSYARPSAGH